MHPPTNDSGLGPARSQSVFMVKRARCPQQRQRIAQPAAGFQNIRLFHADRLHITPRKVLYAARRGL